MVLLGEPDSGPFTPVAVWPDAKLSMHHLTGAAERSLKERRGLLVEKDADPASQNHFPENIHIAYPIEVEGKLHGTVVLGVDETDRNAVQAIMRQLHWRAAWLEVLIRRTQAVSSDAVSQRLQKALDLLVFFTYFEIDYRVTATTVIEGEVQRVVASPFNGYIREAPARPGDVVREGDLLGLLDDRDLKLERLKWLAEKHQYAKQYDEALAKHERAQIHILRAKIEQAAAQISLLDEQLARSRIVAPFDGVIMSGDLSQSLGAPVERGQVLFEVAPLDVFRVIAEVDERDINDIVVGQKSDLVLPSMPGEAFAFVVEKITPVSIAKEGRNYFRVEGHMEQSSPYLRPGMEGIGKITVERRKLIWVWTHEAVDWLRLQMWRWWP
jgi:multidrug resistance efflux pump